MNSPTIRRAILFTEDTDSVETLTKILGINGFQVFSAHDLQSGLDEHRRAPFQLAILNERYRSLPATALIKELLKISWTTHVIIITDKDEKKLHEVAEGLGVLGGIKDIHDSLGLEGLLAVLKNILDGGKS